MLNTFKKLGKTIYLSILQHPHFEYNVQLRCQCKS